MNDCDYCVEHNFSGLKRLLNDNRKSAQIRAAIDRYNIEGAPLDNCQKTAMECARQLTRDPGGMREDIIQKLRAAGYSDGEILEINQVSAYFSYANRTVLGLGCSTEGDILGLSPNKNDDPNDWSHT